MTFNRENVHFSDRDHFESLAVLQIYISYCESMEAAHVAVMVED